ncbi:Flp family type IVb pilin [Croceibacterium aestuarii]|uniref:Flp family type IVb pilin n=1 Tax=Croceibacterium aestuarii TaxID=3064139 RepID=UPI00272DE3FC|nr:Flp family type IVb pilin [Croceibacterium sp. D39]
MKYVHILCRLARDERGATAVEYGMILAGVFLVMVGALSAMGDQQKGTFNSMASAASSAMAGSV